MMLIIKSVHLINLHFWTNFHVYTVDCETKTTHNKIETTFIINLQ